MIRAASKWVVRNVLKRAAPRAAIAMTAAGSAFDYQAQFHHMEQVVVGPEIPPIEIEMLDIADRLPKNPSRSYPRRDASVVKGYVVHHTGVPPQEPEIIAAYHVKKKGWAGIGYHFGIYKGKILVLNDITVISNHTSGHNTRNVGVVVFGDYRDHDLSDEDKRAIEYLDKHLFQNSIYNMTWHSATKATACPGAYTVTFLRNMKRPATNG